MAQSQLNIITSPGIVLPHKEPCPQHRHGTLAGNIPIVFVGVGDPIVDGFVTNLAHPGGNITGLAANDSPIGGKWLECSRRPLLN